MGDKLPGLLSALLSLAARSAPTSWLVIVARADTVRTLVGLRLLEASMNARTVSVLTPRLRNDNSIHGSSNSRSEMQLVW